MRYQLAVLLHTIARHIDSDAGVSVTQRDRNIIDADGNRRHVHTTWVDIDGGHRAVFNDDLEPYSKDCAG